MDIKKIILYIIVGFLAILLFNAWMRDYPPTSEHLSQSVSSKHADGEETTYVRSALTLRTAEKTEVTGTLAAGNKNFLRQLITVKTDVLKVLIDMQDGNIVSAKLPKYSISTEDKDTPVQILNADYNEIYVAQSGLTNTNANQEVSSIKFISTEKIMS